MAKKPNKPESKEPSGRANMTDLEGPSKKIDSSVVNALIFVDFAGPSPHSARTFEFWHAKVTSIDDPTAQGRIKVNVAGLSDHVGGSRELWARLASPGVNSEFDTWLPPRRNDVVLVYFDKAELDVCFVNS
jgi:Type VI secretion system/phage-baseplate injector OB domain